MKPTKEQVRQWQSRNREQKRPPPTPEQTRQELGWDMLREQQKQEKLK